jgi:hypothetical protein
LGKIFEENVQKSINVFLRIDGASESPVVVVVGPLGVGTTSEPFVRFFAIVSETFGNLGSSKPLGRSMISGGGSVSFGFTIPVVVVVVGTPMEKAGVGPPAVVET